MYFHYCSSFIPQFDRMYQSIFKTKGPKLETYYARFVAESIPPLEEVD